MEIQKTKEYGLFETILGNRIINEKKVERLMEDINKGLNLLPYCPIIVYEQNGKLNIVDGQHRFETSVRLGEFVYYVKCDPMDLKQIALLNSRSDKWTNKDFLECYVRLGITDYVVLQDFIKKYNLIYSTAADLLMYGRCIKQGMESFRNGEFKVNHYDAADKIIALVVDIFGRYTFSTHTPLISAMQELQEKNLCDFDQLKRKIAEAPMMMDKQSTSKSYIYNIEAVYNFKCSKRTVIF